MGMAAMLAVNDSPRPFDLDIDRGDDSSSNSEDAATATDSYGGGGGEEGDDGDDDDGDGDEAPAAKRCAYGDDTALGPSPPRALAPLTLPPAAVAQPLFFSYAISPQGVPVTVAQPAIKRMTAQQGGTTADELAGQQRRYYCRYCKQSWPLTFFRNSQQFGAHCSNCSRRPQPHQPLRFHSHTHAQAQTQAQSQSQSQAAPKPHSHAPPLSLPSPPLTARFTPFFQARPQLPAPAPLAPTSAMPRTLSLPPLASLPPPTPQPPPSAGGREEDGACEMLMGMRGRHHNQAASPPQQPRQRLLEEIWRSMCSDLEELHSRVSHAVTEVVSRPTDSVGSTSATASPLLALADFTAREQGIRTAARELVSLAASITAASPTIATQLTPTIAATQPATTTTTINPWAIATATR
jgi:hypothetical protein